MTVLCNAYATLARRAPRPTREELAEAGKWHNPAALASVWDGALEHHNLLLRAEGYTRERAIYLQALLVTGVAFRGFGPQRPGVLAAMGIITGRCADASCTDLGCEGNYIAGGRFHVKHDKVEKSHGTRDVACPALLQQLVDDWLGSARAKLVTCETDAFFIDPATGGAMSDKRMVAYLRVAMRLLSGDETFEIEFNAVRLRRHDDCASRRCLGLTQCAPSQLRRGYADLVAPLPYEAREGACNNLLMMTPRVRC
jgi:hypothetical protein